MSYPHVMEVCDYEDEVSRTANRNWHDIELHHRVRENLPLLNFALGAAGEAGEIADAVKKYVFHGHVQDRDHLVKEAGDLIWYATALGLALGIPLQETLEANIAKLRSRYPEGFSEAASIARADKAPVQLSLYCQVCSKPLDLCQCEDGAKNR